MNKTVLLTGIGGYLGLHCAVELLKQGYNVKGSLRNLKKADGVSESIQQHVDIEDQLSFCELDLTKDDKWDEAMAGCDYLMHVASPNIIKEPKNVNELIEPAVGGTLRALKAAKKANIKRVVLTSTILAMGADTKTGVYKPETWTNPSSNKINTYTKSKTLAEKAAWDYINNQDNTSKMELVVVCPGAVTGPAISDNISGGSLDTIAQLITGKMSMIPSLSLCFADVRDVARIHVQALETPGINGKRFIVAHSEPMNYLDVAQKVKDMGYDKVSTKAAPGFMLKLLSYFNSEVKGLSYFLGINKTADNSETISTFNWNPIPIEKSLEDAAKSVQLVLNKSN